MALAPEGSPFLLAAPLQRTARSVKSSAIRKQSSKKRSFADITYPDDLKADLELAERLFRGEIPFYRYTKRYVSKNGEIIWISLTASLIHDEKGMPIYGLAMVEDITEARRAQDELLRRQKPESLGVRRWRTCSVELWKNLLGSGAGSNEAGRDRVNSRRAENIRLRRQFQILEIEISAESFADFADLVLDEVPA